MAPICSKVKRLAHANNLILSMLLLRNKRKKDRKRRIWIREVFQDRKQDGDFYNLIPKMRYYYERYGDRLFVEHCRMTPKQFDYLFNLVKVEIQKESTKFRNCISPGERLYVALRYLATGCSYRNLSLAFRLGKSTIAEIIPETCNAIWKVLLPLYMRPLTKSSMTTIADDFYKLWNIPNCVGALDGKHINLIAPSNSGSQYFNYKRHHSIVLMAACDANYVFTYVDIGNYGRISYGGVFGGSDLGNAIEKPDFFPIPRKVDKSKVEFPFVFFGDEAFPLKPNLMRPYSGRNLVEDKFIFNYRLSRARRCIEDSFGILCARFRVLRNSIPLKPENAEAVVKACVMLHNFLMIKDGNLEERLYCPKDFGDYVDAEGILHEGRWRLENGNVLPTFRHQGSNTNKRNASAIRDDIKTFFMGDGQVPWQNRYT